MAKKRLSISLKEKNPGRDNRNEKRIWEESKKKYEKRNGPDYHKKDVVVKALRVYNETNSTNIEMTELLNTQLKILRRLSKEEIGEPGIDEKIIDKATELLQEGGE